MEFEDDLNDEMEDAADVGVIFEGLEDPRVERKKLYPLREILFLTQVLELRQLNFNHAECLSNTEQVFSWTFERHALHFTVF